MNIKSQKNCYKPQMGVKEEIMKSVLEEKVEPKIAWVDSNKNVLAAFKQAEADNAALVEMLAEVYCGLTRKTNPPASTVDTGEGKDEGGINSNSILSILSQPHPGWALVDQLTRLKQVAAAARSFLSMDLRQDDKTYHDRVLALGKAFADLDCLSEGHIKVAPQAQER